MEILRTPAPLGTEETSLICVNLNLHCWRRLEQLFLRSFYYWSTATSLNLGNDGSEIEANVETTVIEIN